MMISHAWTSRRASNRGFTLLEVLMAAIVISLGVLGLTALFAGAARQQQVASEMTRSVIATKNAEAMIARTFGQLTASDPDQLRQCFRSDRWYPVPMDDRDYYLKIDNACAGAPADDLGAPVYFLVRPTEPTPVNVYQLVDGWRNALGRNNAINSAPFRNGVSDLQSRRVDPFSITEVRVYTKLRPDNTDPFAVGDFIQRYTLPGNVTSDNNMDWYRNGDPSTDTWRFVRNGDESKGDGTSFPQDFIRFHGDNRAQGVTEGMDVLHVQVISGHGVGNGVIGQILRLFSGHSAHILGIQFNRIIS